MSWFFNSDSKEQNKETQQEQGDNYRYEIDRLMDEHGLGYKDYAIDLEKTTVEETKDNHVVKEKTESGDIISGSWPRAGMETHELDPDAPTWIGYDPEEPSHLGEVGIEKSQLFTHVAIFGTTGTGKSTTLKNKMVQWAYGDEGFCFIDPSGDTSEELLQMLPEKRLDDVIWIEPGSDMDEIVGLNLLKVEKSNSQSTYEEEIAQVTDDMVSILSEDDSMYARMKRIIRNYTRAMINSDRPYSPIDISLTLTNDWAREEFAEHVKEEGMEYVSEYTEKIAEMDEELIEPTLGRLQPMVENPLCREILSHKDSSVSISEAVKNDKIIIVDVSIQNEIVSKTVTTAIMRRIWAACRSRDRDERKPFYLVCDEFDDLLSSETRIKNILSNARKYKLSVILGHQHPRQVPQEVRDEIFNNCDTILALKVNLGKDARIIADRMKDIEQKDIQHLPNYTLYYQIEKDGEVHTPVRTQTFANYPKMRSRKAAEAVKKMSVKRYGSPRISRNINKEEISVVGKLHQSHKTSFDEEEINFKKAVFSTQVEEYGAKSVTINKHLQEGGDEAQKIELVGQESGCWVDLDRVIKRHNILFNDDISEDEALDIVFASDGIEENDGKVKLKEKEAKTLFENEIAYVGEKKDKGKLTGDIHHTSLLVDAYLKFTENGYVVEILEQDNKNDLPDALAKPPVDLENIEPKEYPEKIDELKREHPEVYRFSRGKEIAIEAEEKGTTKPSQPLRNLAKAHNNDRLCVFVTPGKEEGKKAKAKKLENIIQDPLFARKEENGWTHFYNKTRIMDIGDGNPVCPILTQDATENVWMKKGDDLFLFDRRSSEGEVCAKIEVDNFVDDKIDTDDFEAWCWKDRNASPSVWKAYPKNEYEEKTFEDVKKLDRRHKRAKWPFMPQREFENYDRLLNQIQKNDKLDPWKTLISLDSNQNPVIVEYDYENHSTNPLFDDQGTKETISPSENGAQDKFGETSEDLEDLYLSEKAKRNLSFRPVGDKQFWTNLIEAVGLDPLNSGVPEDELPKLIKQGYGISGKPAIKKGLQEEIIYRHNGEFWVNHGFGPEMSETPEETLNEMFDDIPEPSGKDTKSSENDEPIETADNEEVKEKGSEEHYSSDEHDNMASEEIFWELLFEEEGEYPDGYIERSNLKSVILNEYGEERKPLKDIMTGLKEGLIFRDKSKIYFGSPSETEDVKGTEDSPVEDISENTQKDPVDPNPEQQKHEESLSPSEDEEDESDQSTADDRLSPTSQDYWMEIYDEINNEPSTPISNDTLESLVAQVHGSSNPTRERKKAVEEGVLTRDENSGKLYVNIPEEVKDQELPDQEEEKEVMKTENFGNLRWKECFGEAVEFFHDHLDKPIKDHLDGEKHPDRPDTARKYFGTYDDGKKGRGWSPETHEEKKLGFAPPDKNALANHLKEKGFSEKEILATGLVTEDLDALWRGRYVFPYFDSDENPVYAISRTTGDKGGGAAGYDGHPADIMSGKYAKCAHTKEYVAVHEPIYGVETIKDREPLLITEGIADAITAHENGYSCISPVTTRFKQEDLPVLLDVIEKHDVSEVYVVQDNEPAGSEKREFEGEPEHISDAINIIQHGPGLEGAVDTAAYLRENGIEAYVGELPRLGLWKTDLDDFFQDNWGDLDLVLQSAIHPENHPAYDEGRTDKTEQDYTPKQTDGDRSALFELDIRDVTGFEWGERGKNPLGHHGVSEQYFVVLERRGDAYDHKYDASYTPLTFLLCDAGVRPDSDPAGKLSNEEIFEAWKHAKEEGLIPNEDPIPRKALIHVALENDIVDEDDIIEKETGGGEPFKALPDAEYNETLEVLETDYNIEPGRPYTKETSSTSNDDECKHGIEKQKCPLCNTG